MMYAMVCAVPHLRLLETDMTKTDLRNALRNSVSPYMTVKENDGEIRVSIMPTHIMDATGRHYQSACDKAEAIAYYTNDREDALATGLLMWRQFNASCGRIV